MSAECREQLEATLRALGCSEQPDDAVLEYAVSTLCEAVAEDGEEDADHIEHLDLLLAGACGAAYEGVDPLERQTKLTSILLQARAAAQAAPSRHAGGATASGAAAVVATTRQLSDLALSFSRSGSGSGSSNDPATASASFSSSRENVAPAGEGDAGAGAGGGVSDAVRDLGELCGGRLDLDFLAFALERRFGGDAQAAAAWLLDAGEEELGAEEGAWRAQAAAEARRQAEARLLTERNKQAILTKWDLCPVAVPRDPKKGARAPALEAWSGKEEGKPKVRYLEGRVVSNKGEKFIIEKVGEEWDGGSRGKVYTKGKRGKGFM